MPTKTAAPHVKPYSDQHWARAVELGVAEWGQLCQRFGHATYFLERTEQNWPNWRYLDTQEPVTAETEAKRACPACDLLPRPDGCDPCLGRLLGGAASVCCGHGDPDGAWIGFADGFEIRASAERPSSRSLLAVVRHLRRIQRPPRTVRMLERRTIEALLAAGSTREEIETRLKAKPPKP